MTKSTTDQNPGCLTAILQLFRGKPQASKPTGKPSVTVTTTVPDTDAEPLPYRVRDDFLTITERSFYHTLVHAIQGRFVIFAKIRLADIFFVAQPDKNFTYFNQISRRHIDFLLCQPKTIKPIVAIELDDASHQQAERRERDEFVDRVFEAADLPLVRIPAQHAYIASEIIARLQQYLGNDDLNKSPEPAEKPVAESSQTANGDPAAPPLCPKCGIPMVVRTVAKGQYQGRQFYGCKNYPKCREMKPINNKSS